MAKSLKPKKAPVPDKIRNEMLKNWQKIFERCPFQVIQPNTSKWFLP